MQCVIKQHNEIDAQKWNKFVYSSSMGWAYFLYEMIGVDRYASFINLSFAIVDQDNDDEILFVMQLHNSNKHPFLSKLKLRKEKLCSRWGYVLKDNLPKKHFRMIKECYEKYIDAYIENNRIKSFVADLPPLTQSAIENKTAINPLIYFNFAPKIRYTYVVDLSKPDDRMLADCEETTRQAVRKIEAADKYEIVEAQANEQDCQTFIKLHKETYTRTHAKSFIIADEYHQNMFFNLLPKGICKVFFLKEKETQEVVASVAVLLYKNTAYYWWGDSKNEKEIGINKYLLFKVICIIRERFEKTGYFETGGAYVHIRSGKNKGLNDFKKCFGTFLMPIFQGEYSKIRPKWKQTYRNMLQKKN